VLAAVAASAKVGVTGQRSLKVKHWIQPVGSAFALYGFLGASGERTDISAHLLGLLVGLSSIFYITALKRLREKLLCQIGFALGAVSIIVASGFITNFW